MKGNKAVVGIFTYMDDAIKAVQSAKDSGHEFRVYSPVPNHELEEHTLPGKSPVRLVTMTGAVIGLISGFTLAIMCSLDYPMRVSAKDVVSIPGFVVIGYECTILFGAIFTLLAVAHFCRIPDILRQVGFDPRFTCDKFGVVVGCESDEVLSVKERLLGCGAEEVDVRDGL